MSAAPLAVSTARRELAPLADDINREHAEAERAFRGGLEHAIRAGELLLEAKASVGHGDWLPWVEQNCDFSTRLAQKYMRVARELPRYDIGTNTPRVAHLSFRKALHAVASNTKQLASVDEDLRASVLDTMDLKDVKSVASAVHVEAQERLVRLSKGDVTKHVGKSDIECPATWAREHYGELSKTILSRPEFVQRVRDLDAKWAEVKQLEGQMMNLSCDGHIEYDEMISDVKRTIETETGRLNEDYRKGTVDLTAERLAKLEVCETDDDRRAMLWSWAGWCARCGVSTGRWVDDYSLCSWCVENAGRSCSKCLRILTLAEVFGHTVICGECSGIESPSDVEFCRDKLADPEWSDWHSVFAACMGATEADRCTQAEPHARGGGHMTTAAPTTDAKVIHGEEDIAF